ncbi:MAG: DnaJ C-terminal domain-containing protein, partial [Candidatus Hydrogenedentota bacterium]
MNGRGNYAGILRVAVKRGITGKLGDGPDAPRDDLGGEVSVPTLDGVEKIEVEPGTQSGEKIRLRKRGIPHLNKPGKGDQIVRLKAIPPTDLDPEERNLVEELNERLDSPVGNNSDESESFFEKLKN